jgi:hypothetical protein
MSQKFIKLTYVVSNHEVKKLQVNFFYEIEKTQYFF